MAGGPSAGGIIPQPDPECQVFSNQMCACWCGCAEDQYEAANIELPNFCKEDWMRALTFGDAGELEELIEGVSGGRSMWLLGWCSPIPGRV